MIRFRIVVKYSYFFIVDEKTTVKIPHDIIKMLPTSVMRYTVAKSLLFATGFASLNKAPFVTAYAMLYFSSFTSGALDLPVHYVHSRSQPSTEHSAFYGRLFQVFFCAAGQIEFGNRRSARLQTWHVSKGKRPMSTPLLLKVIFFRALCSSRVPAIAN